MFHQTDGAHLFPHHQPSDGSEMADADLSQVRVDNTGAAMMMEGAGAERTSFSSHKSVNGDTAYTATAAPLNSSRDSMTMSGDWIRASQFVGMNVRDSQNQAIGEVKDVVVDLSSGRVVYTVLASGGVLGIGDKLFAVPMPAYSFSSADHRLSLNVDRTRLQSAPVFDRRDWSSATNPTFVTDVYRYYNVTPYWTGTAVGQAEIREPAGAQQNQSQSYSADGEKLRDPKGQVDAELKNPNAARSSEVQSNTDNAPAKTSDSHSANSDASLKEGSKLQDPAGADSSQQKSAIQSGFSSQDDIHIDSKNRINNSTVAPDLNANPPATPIETPSQQPASTNRTDSLNSQAQQPNGALQNNDADKGNAGTNEGGTRAGQGNSGADNPEKNGSK